MNKAQLQPYLFFNGNCEEAMQFYKSVLGGDLEIRRFGDFADKGMKVSEDQKDKVMHATLQHDSLSFMASDAMPSKAVIVGDNVSLTVTGDDEAQLTKFFNGLSEGGTITAPLSKEIWGDVFGMFTDKYGTHWMFSIGSAASANKE